jgi:hypothetical protein
MARIAGGRTDVSFDEDWDGAERRQERPAQRLLAERHWAKIRDWLLVTVALFAITAFMITAVVTIQTNRTVAEINQRQIEVVQQQNDVQICAQFKITLAVRSIGRKLGLDVGDITLPDIEGINCAP